MLHGYTTVLGMCDLGKKVQTLCFEENCQIKKIKYNKAEP